MLVIKSEGTKESRSASRMPRGSSCATWWPRIWEKGKCQGRARPQLDRPSPRARFWDLAPHLALQNFKFLHVSSTQHCAGASKPLRWQELSSTPRTTRSFETRKGCIDQGSHYSTIRSCGILAISQVSITRRLAHGYGKSTGRARGMKKTPTNCKEGSPQTYHRKVCALSAHCL